MRDAPRIRPATAADRPSVIALLGAAGLPSAGVDAVLRGFVVAEEDPAVETPQQSGAGEGKVAGAAGLERYGNYGLLRSLVVAPHRRGEGLGAALTQAVLANARRSNLEAVYALTTTAAHWLPRLGFEPIERENVPEPVQTSPEFSTICPSTAVALRLRVGGLTPSPPAAARHGSESPRTSSGGSR